MGEREDGVGTRDNSNSKRKRGERRREGERERRWNRKTLEQSQLRCKMNKHPGN